MLMSWQGRRVNTLPSDSRAAPDTRNPFNSGSALETDFLSNNTGVHTGGGPS